MYSCLPSIEAKVHLPLISNIVASFSMINQSTMVGGKVFFISSKYMESIDHRYLCGSQAPVRSHQDCSLVRLSDASYCRTSYDHVSYAKMDLCLWLIKGSICRSGGHAIIYSLKVIVASLSKLKTYHSKICNETVIVIDSWYNNRFLIWIKSILNFVCVVYILQSYPSTSCLDLLCYSPSWTINSTCPRTLEEQEKLFKRCNVLSSASPHSFRKYFRYCGQYEIFISWVA